MPQRGQQENASSSPLNSEETFCVVQLVNDFMQTTLLQCLDLCSFPQPLKYTFIMKACLEKQEPFDNYVEMFNM